MIELFRISVVILIFNFSTSHSYPVRSDSGGWKTVPYTVDYRSSRVDRGHGQSSGSPPSYRGGGGYYGGYRSSYDHYPGYGGYQSTGYSGGGYQSPGYSGGGYQNPGYSGGGYQSPIYRGGGYGSGMGNRMSHGYGNSFGQRHGHGVSTPFIPVSVPEKTPYISKLIPIFQFGGALKRLLHYNDEWETGMGSSGYSSRTGESWISSIW